MPIPYHIQPGEMPDEALASFYDQQDDGSYLLRVEGLPVAQEAPADKQPSQEASQAPACHGAGTQTAGTASGIATQTVIAPHDAQSIQKSLHALASGAVRLGK